MPKVFVYGTLRTRHPKATVVPARAQGILYSLNAFPGMVESTNPDDQVVGEILDVSEERLKVLDQYECYNPSDEEQSLYIRKKINVLNEITNTEEEVWVYIFNKIHTPRVFPRIKSGDWFNLNESNA